MELVLVVAFEPARREVELREGGGEARVDGRGVGVLRGLVDSVDDLVPPDLGLGEG